MGVLDELKTLNTILFSLRQTFEKYGKKLDGEGLKNAVEKYEAVVNKMISVAEENTIALRENTAELKKIKP